MRTPLCDLAVKYGSDKYSAKHSYTAWYYEQFRDRRASVRKVVEIGAGEGASLRMWRDFFPNAMIYGADIDPKRCFKAERIDVTRCNQALLPDMKQLLTHTGTDIDLFIDDGSHLLVDQVSTCVFVMSQAPAGTVYAIEDAPKPNLPALLAEYRLDCKAANIPYRRRYDNRLMIVTHRHA